MPRKTKRSKQSFKKKLEQVVMSVDQLPETTSVYSGEQEWIIEEMENGGKFNWIT